MAYKGGITMKISTRGRYSLRMMLDLAIHYSDNYIALKDISARQNISKKYLEQIIPFLNRSGSAYYQSWSYGWLQALKKTF